VETVSVKVLEKYGADLTGLRNAVIELVAQGDGQQAARRGRDLLLADPFGRTCAAELFRVKRHSDENGWLPPGAMDSGRRSGILPNVGWRQT
jgi:hypothetical protein